MPPGKPTVGETWSLLLADSPTQSVICSTDPPGIRLMSRLGRTIVIPNRTLELCGTFQHPALEQTCQHPGSDEHPGYLQIQDHNGAWQWVCAAHLPLQARPLFPYDSPQARDLAELSQCPNCDVIYKFGLATSALLGGQPVHHCTSCGWVWVLLHARGYSDDGAVLVQQVLDLADRLHGFAISTRAEVPPPALRAVCRATGLSIEEGGPSIRGIPFMEQRRFICNDSVVLCQVTAEALRELQAGPVIAKTSSSEPIKGHQKGIKHTRPRPGDIWFHKDSFEPVLIKWTSSYCVKLGDDSSLDLALFSSTYVHYPVTFAVGSELIKKSKSYTGAEFYTILKICQFSSRVTVASRSGGQQELTWSQVLTRYRLLKRRTVNERLNKSR